MLYRFIPHAMCIPHRKNQIVEVTLSEEVYLTNLDGSAVQDIFKQILSLGHRERSATNAKNCHPTAAYSNTINTEKADLVV